MKRYKSEKIRRVGRLVYHTEKRIFGAKFDDGTTTPFDKVPDYVSPSLRKVEFSMAMYGRDLVSLSPQNGLYKVKFSNFSAKEGHPPIPKAKLGKFGEELQAFAILNIVEEDLLNVPILIILRYDKFEYKDGAWGVVGSSKSPAATALSDFLEATGVMDKEYMEPTDNLLPQLEIDIQQANRDFRVNVRDGWVDGIFAADVQPEVAVAVDVSMEWD